MTAARVLPFRPLHLHLHLHEIPARVIPLPARVQPVELPYVKHQGTGPNDPSDPTEVCEHRIEQQLRDAWDTQTDPYAVLRLFAPEWADDAESLLDQLFRLSAEAADAEMRGAGLQQDLYVAQYEDVLWRLACLSRGEDR